VRRPSRHPSELAFQRRCSSVLCSWLAHSFEPAAAAANLRKAAVGTVLDWRMSSCCSHVGTSAGWQLAWQLLAVVMYTATAVHTMLSEQAQQQPWCAVVTSRCKRSIR
jgi:hypothetical protein